MTQRPPSLRVLPTGSSSGAEPELELAPGLDTPPTELDRRQLMQLLAAGAGLAGVGSIAGCMAPPEERIMPRVEQPPELTPGVPASYATAMVIDGFATGLVVTAHEARPTKIEGNPDHPASLGATSALHQASILELYDPQRARGATVRGTSVARDRVIHEIAARAGEPGLWFLLPPQSSPLIADLIARIRRRHPGARFATHAALDRRAVYEGARLAFGRPVEAQYRFDVAAVVVALDADFLAAMPSSVRWSRDFARRRRVGWPIGEPSRLYVAEPRPTPTGSLADHRLAARASDVRVLAAGLLAAVRGTAMPGGLSARALVWVRAAAADLVARRGAGLVVVGDRQPAEVHALGHAINAAIGAAGRTVALTEPAVLDPLGDGPRELAAAIRARQVRTLVIAEANPVYDAPPDLELAALIASVPETIYAGLTRNETSAICAAFVPLAHYLESWGDARAYDGTITLIQPLIRPLYDSVALPELLAAFAGDRAPDAHRMLRARYGAGAPEAEPRWQAQLRLGLIAGSARPPLDVTPRLAGAALDRVIAGSRIRGGFEVAFAASPALYDGRFAGIAWLQELPDPHTKQTWGNAAVISPATARGLGVGDGDVLRFNHAGRLVDLPVYVLPGHADDCATLDLGHGRRAGGPVAEGVGTDVTPLRLAATPGFATGVVVTPTGAHVRLATTQQHFDQDDRHIAITAELAAYRAHPDFTEPYRAPEASMLPADPFPDTPKWGMSIDTMLCTGCSACVIACQAENNVPVVGREGVLRNREMHWLRIDTYRERRGDDDVAFVHQPMLCQHCEDAPCEYVCPTYATQHSPDGLNEMIYNRCIGTRFCSNNCPYKIRRFNWFDYTEDTPKPQRLQYNPNVTVRARGVMEKCTYCVQRIRGADIAARTQRRAIRPGEVATACQQACPTGAIQFGLLTHADTDVVRWRHEPRRYEVLHDLGTRPKTIYLAKITNPNPKVGR